MAANAPSPAVRVAPGTVAFKQALHSTTVSSAARARRPATSASSVADEEARSTRPSSGGPDSEALAPACTANPNAHTQQPAAWDALGASCKAHPVVGRGRR